ncbi:MAG: flippase-like domain-containing protein, partial [Anaerolineales bacterium]|nr:flippase-like domain-containing protein [Anaerolineales bacterium]
MKRWQFWLGMAISAIFLWLALRGLKLTEVWQDIRSANYLWLIPSVAVYFVAVWARTWRWDYMLRPLKHVPLRRLFPVVVIGYMGNNVYPFRAGELLRSYVLRRRENVSISASLATVIVERVFDGLVMLVFVFAALPFAPIPGDNAHIRAIVIFASIAFFAAMVIFFALAAMPER